MPTYRRNPVTANRMGTQTKIWRGWSRAGNGHGQLRNRMALLRKLVILSGSGGNGSVRPGRSLNTVSTTIPLMALPGPAMAMWTR
jgi:hypothetical protein